MAEFIGARISLVSNSDIRYVGTLHEINTETSTVALENVSMLGTEGRRPDNEVAALDSIYEYILFRGTDVKDLRIEEAPTIKKNKAPQIPNDPAILGSGTRPTPKLRSPNQQQTSSTQSHGQHILSPTHSTQVLPQTVPSYGQQTPYPHFYPQPPGWGRNAPPAPGGYTANPYAGPPVWYHGPQPSFPPGTQFAPYGYSAAPSNMEAQQQSTTTSKPIPIGVLSNKSIASTSQHPKKTNEIKTPLKAAEMPAAPVQKILTPPASSQLSPKAIQSDTSLPILNKKYINTPESSKLAPTGPKTVNRVKPVIPLRNVPQTKDPLKSSSGNTSLQRLNESSVNLKEATEAASVAVSTAMAKLPLTTVKSNPVDEKGQKNLIKNIRKSSRSNASTERSRRGNHRSQGSRSGSYVANLKVEVPSEDFDFQSANAKFNKDDLIKEAISASPVAKGGSHKSPVDTEKPVTYNKATSFFDNISSEAKDRQETGNSRSGGREWRGEEQKKNLETFGQESIDNNYRGGYRGRGRGRGRGGYRGRGFSRNIPSSRGRTEHQSRSSAQAVS